MQLIIYLAAAFSLLIFAFFIFRIIVRRDYQKKGRLRWFTTMLETLIFALHAHFSFIYLPAKWPTLPRLPENQIQSAIGLFMITLGLILVIIAITWFGLQRTLGRKVDELIESRFYSVSRNPQIITYGLMILGYALLWPSWYALGWVIIYVSIAHMMVITEEEHLRKIHGESYIKYCERVPRYLSFLWRK